jgi:hypothetical protein
MAKRQRVRLVPALQNGYERILTALQLADPIFRLPMVAVAMPRSLTR